MRVPQVSVIGDLMIDVDNVVEETLQREERDVFKISRSIKRLGAAGAVASMVAALGCEVRLFATAHLRQVQSIKQMTPGFAHILGHDQQTTIRERFQRPDGTPIGPRIDRGARVDLIPDDQRSLAMAAGSGASAVIVCDHALGVVGRPLMDHLRAIGVPIFVDPHIDSDFAAFGGVECVCANREEAIGAGDIVPDPKHFLQKMDRDGLWWYRAGWREAPPSPQGVADPYRLWFSSCCDNPVDTLGAGDQFISALTVARIRGEDWETAILSAVIAAGIQCERRGIVPVTWDEIKKRFPQ